MDRPDFIKHVPQRPVVANVLTRLRTTKLECAIADVKGVIDLDRLPPHVAAYARQAEGFLLELLTLVKGLPTDER